MQIITIIIIITIRLLGSVVHVKGKTKMGFMVFCINIKRIFNLKSSSLSLVMPQLYATIL